MEKFISKSFKIGMLIFLIFLSIDSFTQSLSTSSNKISITGCTQRNNNPSSSFTITGNSLSNILTISGGLFLTVSLDNINFHYSLTITPVAGSVNVTIYVKGSAVVPTDINENIKITCLPLPSIFVLTTGTIGDPPTLIINSVSDVSSKPGTFDLDFITNLVPAENPMYKIYSNYLPGGYLDNSSFISSPVHPFIKRGIKAGTYGMQMEVYSTGKNSCHSATVNFALNILPSNNSDLSNLSFTNLNLSTPFSSGTINYTSSVSYNVSSTTITPVPADQNASVTVNGVTIPRGSSTTAQSLSQGINTFNITVTAEDGTTKTYAVTINRAAPLPSITSFSPTTAGPNNSVTILGSNFVGITSVSFGGTTAASFTVISPSQINALVNSTGSSGTVAIVGSAGQSSLPGFTFSSTLPINFIYFNSEKKDRGPLLKWGVADNNDAKEYIIERSSNGTGFTAINTINGNNNAAFEWLDQNPLAGVSYYRIKTRSIASGFTIYSKILTVENSAQNGSVTIYPNPIKGRLVNLKFHSIRFGIYKLTIINALGKDIYNSKIVVGNALITTQLQLPNSIPSGLYILKITDGKNITKTQSLIITR